MSKQNVEIAKRMVDAFNRRDVDVIVELATVDFEWFPAMPGIAAGSCYRGREGIETYLADIEETWEEYRSVAEELRDLGERVLVLGRLEGRGRGSGALVDAPQGTILDFLGWEISRVRTYLDHGEALRVAGLAEWASPPGGRVSA
jgi:ketosteroid isomerase-like protein